MSNETEQDHGKQNAASWVSNLSEMVAALNCDYDRLEELRDERAMLADNKEEAETYPDADDESKAGAVAALAEWDAANAEELESACTISGDKMKDADEARERIQESPLSVQVRSGWRDPGSMENAEAEEFEILLTTGGPALRIRGELDGGQPSRAWLEYRDWGTPWTQYFEVEQSTLLEYCQVFYFGE